MTEFQMHPRVEGMYAGADDPTAEEIEKQREQFALRRGHVLDNAKGVIAHRMHLWKMHGDDMPVNEPRDLTGDVRNEWLYISMFARYACRFLQYRYESVRMTRDALQLAMDVRPDLRMIPLSTPEARMFWHYMEWAFAQECPHIAVVPAPFHRIQLREVAADLALRHAGLDRFPEPDDIHIFVSDFARDARDNKKRVVRDEGIDALPWYIQAQYYRTPDPLLLIGTADDFFTFRMGIRSVEEKFLVDLLPTLNRVLSWRETYHSVNGEPWTFRTRDGARGPTYFPKEQRAYLRPLCENVRQRAKAA